MKKYVESFTNSTKITASKFAIRTQLDTKLASKTLNVLVCLDILSYNFVIRCPQCGLLLNTVCDMKNLDNEVYCYGCEQYNNISSDDVEVIYTVKSIPFVMGQQNDADERLVISAVPFEDSLTNLLQQNDFNINSIFYSPTESEMMVLEEQYNSIFSEKQSTTSKGASLEQLVINLFGICKQFEVTGDLKLHPNQIDCYVRNKLCSPGIPGIGYIDSFVIECKNEENTPKSTYMNKLHSILKLSNKQFGIIVSKFTATKTFVNLANQIYLNDKITIISFSNEDLREIILNRNNLLECIERKINEIKLNATKDLETLGLYKA